MAGSLKITRLSNAPSFTIQKATLTTCPPKELVQVQADNDSIPPDSLIKACDPNHPPVIEVKFKDVNGNDDHITFEADCTEEKSIRDYGYVVIQYAGKVAKVIVDAKVKTKNSGGYLKKRVVTLAGCICVPCKCIDLKIGYPVNPDDVVTPSPGSQIKIEWVPVFQCYPVNSSYFCFAGPCKELCVTFGPQSVRLAMGITGSCP